MKIKNLNKQANENNQQNLDPKLAMLNCQRLKERSAWHPYRLPCISSAASACIYFLFFISVFLKKNYYTYTHTHTHSFYIAHIQSNKTKQAKNSTETAVQGHLSEEKKFFFSFLYLKCNLLKCNFSNNYEFIICPLSLIPHVLSFNRLLNFLSPFATDISDSTFLAIGAKADFNQSPSAQQSGLKQQTTSVHSQNNHTLFSGYVRERKNLTS